MQGRKQLQYKTFYSFCLDDCVPEDHYLRRIDRHLDLHFLYHQTLSCYGSQGQKSIDPVVFFKMQLIGYLNNITADRALVRFCDDSLACRWFLGYDIDEALPVHSTLSRTRALFGEAVYEQVFRQILGMCIDAGMVEGKRQVVDSGLVKAYASVDGMQRKAILEDVSHYCRQAHQGNDDNNDDDAEDEGGSSSEANEDPAATGANMTAVELPDSQQNPKPPRRSNKTHFSPTDSDARLACKPGKPTDLYYHGHVCVDDAECVIVAAGADYGDSQDHQALGWLIEQSLANLVPHRMRPKELLADSHYNTVHTLRWCKLKSLTAYMPNPSGYKRHRDGFSYDRKADRYTCQMGKHLEFSHYQKTAGGRYYNKVYAAKTTDCNNCPMRQECLTSKKPYKSLTHSSGKHLYDEMYDRLCSGYGSWLQARRKGRVEPVLGTLLEYKGMKKTWARGKPAATKHLKMASCAYNLNKWLKRFPNGLRQVVDATQKGAYELGDIFYDAFWDYSTQLFNRSKPIHPLC